MPKIYVWVSTQEQSRRCSQNLDRPLLSSQTLILFNYITLIMLAKLSDRAQGSSHYQWSRKALIGTGWVISLLLCTIELRKQSSHISGGEALSQSVQALAS